MAQRGVDRVESMGDALLERASQLAVGVIVGAVAFVMGEQRLGHQPRDAAGDGEDVLHAAVRDDVVDALEIREHVGSRDVPEHDRRPRLLEPARDRREGLGGRPRAARHDERGIRILRARPDELDLLLGS